MSNNLVVVLREDPMSTHRPVEGLRMALGLSTGQFPLTIILLGKSRTLLTDDALDVVDADILEKYIPSIQDLEIPIVVSEGSFEDYDIDPAFSVTETSIQDMQSQLINAHRVMVLG